MTCRCEKMYHSIQLVKEIRVYFTDSLSTLNISQLVTTQSKFGGITLKPLPGTENFWLLHTIIYIYI